MVPYEGHLRKGEPELPGFPPDHGLPSEAAVFDQKLIGHEEIKAEVLLNPLRHQGYPEETMPKAGPIPFGSETASWTPGA